MNDDVPLTLQHCFCFDLFNTTTEQQSPPFRNLDNVLITDECADYSEPPDDDDQGGIFTFRFHCDATIHLIGFLDVEEKSRPDIKFIRSDGTTVEKGPYTLNNRCKFLLISVLSHCAML